MNKFELCKQNGVAIKHPMNDRIFLCGSKDTCEFQNRMIMNGGLSFCMVEKPKLPGNVSKFLYETVAKKGVIVDEII